MSAGGEPITKCPVCRYDRTGLPRNHRCPECGFEYNETMRVWIAPDRSRAAVLGVILYLVACAFFSVVAHTRGGLGNSFATWKSVQYFFFLLLAIVIYRMWRSRPFIAVGATRLCWRMPLDRPRHRLWIDIVFTARRSRNQGV